MAAYGLETEVSGRNDVLCQGRKFSGNAFSKGKHQRLHHGTILIRTDVEQLQRYLKVKPAKLQKHGVSSVQSRVVNLSELAPEITAQNIIPPLVQAFEQEYGTPLQTIDFNTLTSLPEVQELAADFKAQTGSLICRELLRGYVKNVSTDPTPEARTDEYYKKRPCVRMVELAIRTYMSWLKRRRMQL